MTNVLSVRLPSGKMARLDQRAASSGLDRSEFVRRLIEQALEEPVAKNKGRRFASMDLCGHYSIGGGSDNAAVRAALAKRAK